MGLRCLLLLDATGLGILWVLLSLWQGTGLLPCGAMQDEILSEDMLSRAENVSGMQGLSAREVEERTAQGLANADTDVKTKSVPQILAEHTFTLFNAVNVALAALVFMTGQYRNMLFMVIVAANFVIGIVQEIRAKLIIDRLTLLTATDVDVVRDGRRQTVKVSGLVLGDTICLAHGDQVPADARILSGHVRMNESLITGESDAVKKGPGDEILSGSFVDTGSLMAEVTKVGTDSYAARINAEAKYVKAVKSEIRDSLQMVIRFSTALMPFLGAGLFLRSVFSEGMETDAAILTVVAALVSMIPQGLMLLTSSVLAIATTRLGHKAVLVQQSYCVETLARVDTICLDKTGTITSGKMEVAAFRPAAGRSVHELERAAATIVRSMPDDANETAEALMRYAEERGIESPAAVRAIHFSSERKYSGCVTADGHAFVMGAAQFVLGGRYPEVADEISSLGSLSRVLVVGEAAGFGEDGELEGPVELFGFCALRDEIRPTARDTIAYFGHEGVRVYVISGDDPRTVSGIAAEVGVPGAQSHVDASTLGTEEDIEEALRTKRVFGRVTPQQKRQIVDALERQGHTVAMTGDGVNDVLALKAADCSVAMASGSAAARNVSEIVLADNDFAHMPEVVAEGRRSINNLQRSASLFLVKTGFAIVLCFICIFFPPFPFLPIQESFLSGLIIGYPSFVLALEPNHERLKGDFLANVLARSLPASISIVFILAVTMFLEGPFGWTFAETSTLCLLLVCLVGVGLIFNISRPLTPLRIALIVSVIAGIAGGSLLFGNFFLIEPLTATMGVYLLIGGGASLILFEALYFLFTHEGRCSRHLESAVRKAEVIYGQHRSRSRRSTRRTHA